MTVYLLTLQCENCNKVSEPLKINSTFSDLAFPRNYDHPDGWVGYTTEYPRCVTCGQQPSFSTAPFPTHHTFCSAQCRDEYKQKRGVAAK